MGSRVALDRCLLQEARARPAVEAWPSGRHRAVAAWAVVSLGCLLMSALLGIVSWRTQATTQDLVARAGFATVPPRSAPLSRAEMAEVRIVNAAIRQINLPLPAILRALQPPRDIAVVLVSLDMAGRDGDAEGSNSSGVGALGAIKLSAVATSAIDMTRYVSFLDEGRGFSAARLTRHELDLSEPPGVYRFEVELAWQR